jgi:hypothetical protein
LVTAVLPLTPPVLVLKRHEDLTAVAVSPVGVTAGLAMVNDALVGSAAFVTTPVVSGPVTLT